MYRSGPIRSRRMAMSLLGCALALLAERPVRGEAPPVSSPHAGDGAAVHEGTFAANCSDCHDCEHPTAEDPCLIVCPRHDRRFFGTHEEEEGPEVVVIDQLADLYGPVVFAHRRHANMSALSGGCQNCHHYSEPSGAIPPCRECHDAALHVTNLRRPALKGAYHRQCINCHRDWSHENACEFCHEDAVGGPGPTATTLDTTDIVGIRHPLITAPPTYTYQTDYEEGPLVTFHHADHVDAFGQACVDCHRGDSCGRCHDALPSEPSRLDHVTSCFSCHFERDCGFCHTQDAQPRFHHAHSAEWPLNPYHEGVACSTCHDEPEAFRTPERRCVSCHIHWASGGFDHSLTGLVLNEEHVDADCSDCHQDMDFTLAPTCTECHDDAMLPELLPGTRTPDPGPRILDSSSGGPDRTGG